MAVSRSESPVEMSTVTTSELGLGERIDKVSRRESRILVEENGEPVAVIVSLTDYRAIQSADRKREEAIARLDRISLGFSDLSDEEIDLEIESAIKEVEDERRGAAHGKPE